jgi:capsular exopolysaccharide synthesis family protein
MFLSVLTGAVLGVMAALLRDRLDHVFHSPREVQAQLGLPLLGTVPNLPIESGRSLNETIDLMDQVERFALRESLRNLSTNFRMLRADRPVRLMTVTSTTQREGKTTIVALFGLTLSELGQRVLLVDADMRRPSLHRRLGMINERGISNAFTDPEVRLSTLIQPVTDRLDLISAGPPVPDATKLLSSDRCSTLVEEIRAMEGYDIVLFDSPPSLNLADPLLLSVHLDGLLFLVGVQRVDRNLPEQAIERIRDTGVDLLGLVTNQVVPPVGSGGFGYGYGYGYGYGTYGHYAYSRYIPTAASDSASEDQPSSYANRPQGRGLLPASKRLAQQAGRRLVNWLDGRR